MGRQPNTMQETGHLKFQCFLKPLIFHFSQAYFVTNGVKRFPKCSLRAKNSPCPSSYLNLLSRVSSSKIIIQSHRLDAKYYHFFLVLTLWGDGCYRSKDSNDEWHNNASPTCAGWAALHTLHTILKILTDLQRQRLLYWSLTWSLIPRCFDSICPICPRSTDTPII